MKYALPFITLVLVICSCRSSKQTDSHYQWQQTSRQEEQRTRRDSVGSTQDTENSSLHVASEKQYIRTITFDSLGRISSVQEQFRNYESGRLDESKGRSGTVSVNNVSEKSSNQTDAGGQSDIREQEDSDSRLLQGVEWLYVVVPVIVGTILLIVFRKRIFKQ